MKSLRDTDVQADRPSGVPEDGGKRYLTIDEIVEKWAGVFEPEFWEDVRNARRSGSSRKERE